MRTIILLALLFFTHGLRAQLPVPSTWTFSGRIEASPDEMSLQAEHTEDTRNRYATRIRFQSDGRWFLWYSAPCGNDCLTNWRGRYELLADGMRLWLGTISSGRRCFPDSIPRRLIGTYHLLPVPRGFRMLASLEDEPRKDYFAALMLDVPPLSEPEAQALVEDYRRLYYRIFQLAANRKTQRYRDVHREAWVWMKTAYAYANACESTDRQRVRQLYKEWHDTLTGMLKAPGN